MEIWADPGKYLGLPAIWGRNRTASLMWIKDKILGKMESWKGSLLNQAGKEVLVKSVIQAIPTFAMAIVKFPKTFTSSLNAAVAKFWWKSQGKERGVHWRSWQHISRSKKEGGLGFRDFHYQNLAYLAKQAWRFEHSPNALWVTVLKAIYCPNGNFLEEKKGRNQSWMWTSLLEGRDLLNSGGRWAIGTGEKINVWEDSWIWTGERLARSQNTPPLKVAELLKESGDVKILQTPVGLRGVEDSLIWPHTNSGEYTIKTGYHVARSFCQESILNPSSSLVIPNELWGFIWGRNMTRESTCPICNMEDETIEHALLFCPWTCAAWFGSPLQWIINRVGFQRMDLWILQQFNFLNSVSTHAEEDFAIFSLTLWAIWKGRNRVIFQHEAPNTEATIRQLSLLIHNLSNTKPVIIKERMSSDRSTFNDRPWRPPLPRMLKLNVDASWKASSPLCSIGIAVRDEAGLLVAGSASKAFSHSALMAEALAFREAIILAHNMGWSEIEVESDCLPLVEACRDGKGQGEIHSIVADILNLRRHFQWCGFSWIPRNSNKVAHEIAKLNYLNDLGPYWLFSLHPAVKSAVIHDARLIPPRVPI
ncbi:uncharacterized protein LOC130737292 [Lotus japonicus]|uniref:uncharacterized protein LOC130737292 n=1 Tax=Lotus japonicus TaxID=34305 RepID=UPI00258E27E3|nr:uncharacterized protein LOC130737292 [Lotus japonicus]